RGFNICGCAAGSLLAGRFPGVGQPKVDSLRTTGVPPPVFLGRRLLTPPVAPFQLDVEQFFQEQRTHRLRYLSEVVLRSRLQAVGPEALKGIADRFDGAQEVQRWLQNRIRHVWLSSYYGAAVEQASSLAQQRPQARTPVLRKRPSQQAFDS